MLFEKFFEVIDALDRENVDYIIIGGFAVILYGLPRLTQDLDIFVNPDEENIRKLREALKSVFKDDCIEEITLNELNDYPVIRYGTPGGFNIDIIIRIGEAFSFSDLDFDVKEIESHKFKIATPETLVKLKKDTFREIDKADVLFLNEIINKEKKK